MGLAGEFGEGMAERKPFSVLETELLVSPVVTIGVLAVMGFGFSLAVGPWAADRPLHHLSLLSAIAYVCAIVAACLQGRQPRACAWFATLSMAALLLLGYAWLGTPGLLVLAVLPAALLASMAGVRAAVLLAALETVALLVLARRSPTPLDVSTVAAIVVAIWGALGVIDGLSRRLFSLESWYRDYHGRARDILEQARSDRAELKQTLADLAHANRQLALAGERVGMLRRIAEDARRSKENFVARVSHEFRTPLNIIIGTISMIVESPETYDGEIPRQVVQALQTAYKSCQHLAGMIDDVLDLSQADAGRVSMHRESTDLAEIVRTVMEIVRPLLEQKGLHWQIAIPEDLPRILCDRVRIRQVMLNLVSNAARCTERGSISVSATEQPGQVLIRVSDTGPGIAGDLAARLFEPFFRGSSPAGQTSTGLGLSISKRFVELHGGRIWFETAVGVGTTFFVELPLGEPAPHAPGPAHRINEDWMWVERETWPHLPSSHYKPRVVMYDETGDLHAAFARVTDDVEFVDTRSIDRAIQDTQQMAAQALVLNATTREGLWPLVERAAQDTPGLLVLGCMFPPRAEHALRAGAVDYITKPLARARLREAIGRLPRPIRRVLVVDDDADTRALLSQFLKADDDTLSIVSVENGQRALEELHRAPFDLLLLDVAMPGIDGWQVLAAKNQDPSLRGVPAIMISAQDYPAALTRSGTILATMGEGLSINQVLDCSAALARILTGGA